MMFDTGDGKWRFIMEYTTGDGEWCSIEYNTGIGKWCFIMEYTTGDGERCLIWSTIQAKVVKKLHSSVNILI